MRLVVKDNALIDASYTLGLTEQRLILLAILEARERQTVIASGTLLRIHASSYAEQFKVTSQTAYVALQDAAKGIFEAHFRYTKADEATGKMGYYRSRWVEKIGYIPDLGCVELSFSNDVIPLITRLEQRFTEYDIDQISGLKSSYALRLYELAIKWRSVGKTPVISLDELREKLGILNHEYERQDNFKRRVLEVAIKQINEKTDIVLEYKQHKSGKLISGFSFTFTTKKIDKSIKKIESVPQDPPEKQPAIQVEKPAKENKQIAAFAGMEKTLFNALKKKSPTLTEAQIRQLAEEDAMSIFEILQLLTTAYQSQTSFEL